MVKKTMKLKPKLPALSGDYVFAISGLTEVIGETVEACAFNPELGLFLATWGHHEVILRCDMKGVISLVIVETFETLTAMTLYGVFGYCEFHGIECVRHIVEEEEHSCPDCDGSKDAADPSPNPSAN